MYDFFDRDLGLGFSKNLTGGFNKRKKIEILNHLILNHLILNLPKSKHTNVAEFLLNISCFMVRTGKADQFLH